VKGYENKDARSDAVWTCKWGTLPLTSLFAVKDYKQWRATLWCSMDL